jgi:hypothetical protein
MTEGMDELGSDRLFTAILEQKRYNLARYRASIRHALRGTVLDWQVAVGPSVPTSLRPMTSNLTFYLKGAFVTCGPVGQTA